MIGPSARSAAAAACATAAMLAAPATARAAQDGAADAFVGPYAGVEAGGLEHHVFLTVTDPSGRTVSDRYHRAWGFGGGPFAGYDHALAPRWRVSAEASLGFGGGELDVRFPDGGTFVQEPRYGYRVTARPGYLVRPDLLAYAVGGFGGHCYDISGTTRVAGAEACGASFVIGAGARYRLNPAVELRAEFRHLDNQSNELMIGAPVRF